MSEQPRNAPSVPLENLLANTIVILREPDELRWMPIESLAQYADPSRQAPLKISASAPKGADRAIFYDAVRTYIEGLGFEVQANYPNPFNAETLRIVANYPNPFNSRQQKTGPEAPAYGYQVDKAA